MKPKIIFHLPLKIDPNRHSASNIRPLKMLEAFKNIGYEVDTVMGNGKERKEAIKRIKRAVENGVNYDFLYSESSTMPTLLTESHHLPIYPFLDFGFFKFCKKKGIPIGLFYRDVYWAFSENVRTWKDRIAKHFYLYDLIKYKQLLDVLFVPSVEMTEYIPGSDKIKTVELPSGLDLKLPYSKKMCEDKESLELIYVGGIGGNYDLTMLLKMLKEFPNIHLTLCCRESDWQTNKSDYLPLMSDNIYVIHKSGRQLEEHYQNSDLGVLFLKPSTYLTFAMPYKLMEYIGHGLPVLASKNTKTAQFVETHNCGIVSDYNEESLRQLLSNLSKESLMKMDFNKIVSSHTWDSRAKEVRRCLT